MDTGGGWADLSDDRKLGGRAGVPVHQSTEHAFAAGIANGRRYPAQPFVYLFPSVRLHLARPCGAGLSGPAMEDRHTLIVDEVLLQVNCHNDPMTCSAPSAIPDNHAVSR